MKNERKIRMIQIVHYVFDEDREWNDRIFVDFEKVDEFSEEMKKKYPYELSYSLQGLLEEDDGNGDTVFEGSVYCDTIDELRTQFRKYLGILADEFDKECSECEMNEESESYNEGAYEQYGNKPAIDKPCEYCDMGLQSYLPRNKKKRDELFEHYCTVLDWESGCSWHVTAGPSGEVYGGDERKKWLIESGLVTEESYDKARRAIIDYETSKPDGCGDVDTDVVLL